MEQTIDKMLQGIIPVNNSDDRFAETQVRSENSSPDNLVKPSQMVLVLASRVN